MCHNTMQSNKTILSTSLRACNIQFFVVIIAYKEMFLIFLSPHVIGNAKIINSLLINILYVM